MRPFTVIMVIIVLMSVYAMVMLPMQAGSFPAWLDMDTVEFLLAMLCVVCFLVMWPR